MNTSTASAPATISFAAVDAARKAAAAKAAAAKAASGSGVGAGAKAAATRRARLEAQAAQVAQLAAEREQAIADAPVRRARLSVERARKFDEAAARHEQMVARFARLAEMKAAVEVVNTLAEKRPIPGWDGYLVDDEGRVWSRNWPGRPDYELHQTPDKDGYLRVRLRYKGRDVRRPVHRLVLRAFVGSSTEQTRHLDGDPSNNRLSNLVYGTGVENAADRAEHGHTYRGERHHNAAKTHCPQDHELTPDNTYVTPKGKRECRTCKRARSNKGRR